MASAKTTAANRQQPNVLVTGTPGTGKTTLAAQLAERTGFEHINVAELVKARGLHDGYDAEFDTLIMDEDKVCDELEVLLGTGGKVVDHHSCDFFPERWFDVVAVLQTDNTVLYDRLSARGYAQNKISENVTCEIMQVVVDQARESYTAEVVIELQSDNPAQGEANLETLISTVQAWSPAPARGAKPGGGGRYNPY